MASSVSADSGIVMFVNRMSMCNIVIGIFFKKNVKYAMILSICTVGSVLVSAQIVLRQKSTLISSIHLLLYNSLKTASTWLIVFSFRTNLHLHYVNSLQTQIMTCQ